VDGRGDEVKRITTLNPRFAPTAARIETGCVDAADHTIDDTLMTCDDTSVDHDPAVRDPSRYFMVYEVGDNITVQAGEANPLPQLYYGLNEINAILKRAYCL